MKTIEQYIEVRVMENNDGRDFYAVLKKTVQPSRTSADLAKAISSLKSLIAEHTPVRHPKALIQTLNESHFLTLEEMVYQTSNALDDLAEHPKYYEEIGVFPLHSNHSQVENLILALRTDIHGEYSVEEAHTDASRIITHLNGYHTDLLSDKIKSSGKKIEEAYDHIHYLLLTPDEFTTLSDIMQNTERRKTYQDKLTTDESGRDIGIALIKTAIQNKASDIHLEPKGDDINSIRFRVNGVLYRWKPHVANAVLQRIVSAYKNIASGVVMEEKRRPQDGVINLSGDILESYPELSRYSSYSLRLSIVPSLYGESVVLRILNARDKKLDLSSLGLPQNVYEKYADIITSPQGLILVTGPTGSGKTTTLHASLEYLSSDKIKLISIEDPIEMELRGMVQSQVNPSINYDFKDAMRSFLRHDPDMMLVGEIRDEETALIAMRAANTGHIVFSTLHTNDAVQTILRLIDLDVPKQEIAQSLRAVLAQRLIRTLCDHCREPYDAAPALNELLGGEYFSQIIGYKNSPRSPNKVCEYCSEMSDGYSGRQVVVELWPIGKEEKHLIYTGCNEADIYQEVAIKNGMVPLLQEGMDLFLQGKTTLEEMQRVLGNKEEFIEQKGGLVSYITKYVQKNPIQVKKPVSP